MNKIQLQQNRRGEQGSALIYVFIGIALFAALLFTFSKSSTNTSSTGTTGNAKILAAEILSQTEAIATTVNKLLQKGCSESDLRFYKQDAPGGFGNAGNLNGYVPLPLGDPKCQVFYPTGGNMPPPPYNPQMFATDNPGVDSLWGATGHTVIFGVGSDDGNGSCPGCDLIVLVRGITPEICTEINKILNIDPLPIYFNDVDTNNGYQGSATFGKYDELGDSNTPTLNGKSAFCMKDQYYYEFIRVVIAR